MPASSSSSNPKAATAAASAGSAAVASDRQPTADAANVGTAVVGPTRARILQAARTRFFQLGFARCTMDDLAGELGMSKKTLYQHFRRKEEIIDTLITTKAGEIRDGFEAILALPDLTCGERAARLLRHGVGAIGEMSVSFLHDLRRFAPASYARLEDFRRRVAPGVWERLLREGIEEGAVRADVDPAATARLILEAMQALMLPDTLQRLQFEPPALVARFMTLIFAGVLTDAGRTDYENNPPFSTFSPGRS